MRLPRTYILLLIVLVGLVELVWYVLTSPGLRQRFRAAAPQSAPAEPVPITPGEEPPSLPPGAAPSLRPLSLTNGSFAPDELRAAAKGSNIVICVLDAARADHLGCCGYPRSTTPNIDRFAREGLVFDQHFCQYPQTTPSTASLFTGQHPDTHGLVGVPKGGGSLRRTVDPSSFTIEKALAKAGLRTFLLSSNQAASPAMGVGADFQHIYPPEGMTPRELRREGGGRKLKDSVSVLLAEISGSLTPKDEKPFFAYIHFLPPHSPYWAPDDMRDAFKGKQPPGYWQGEAAFTEVSRRFHAPAPPARGEEWVNLYDGNLLWADWAFGELVKLLKQTGAYDNTLLIVTSDHGEALGEHTYEWHASCPYDEAIRIPLIVKFPGKRGPVGRVGALTQSVDILPTLMDLYRTPYPREVVQGKSLLPLVTGQADKVNDYIVCRTSGDYPCYVVRDHRYALLLYRGGKLRALYDLHEDPRQTRNLIAERPAQADKMAAAFANFAKRQRYTPLEFLDPDFEPVDRSSQPQIKLSEDTRRELRALGYLE